jgi:hypothetical protein
MAGFTDDGRMSEAMQESVRTGTLHDAPRNSEPAEHPRKQAGTATSRLPLLFLTIFIGFGTYVRVADLGRRDFGVDELFQVYAAQGMLQGDGAVLPSGRSYTRGIDVTRLVRLSFERSGVGEIPARLPSSAFGVLGLFLFAGALFAMGGAWVAVVGTALFAVYPEAVQQSRELRFYTYQLLFGVAAFYTGWRSVKPPDGPLMRPAYLHRLAWTLATVALLVQAARVQLVSMSVWVAYAVIVIIAATVDLWHDRSRAWRLSLPVHLSAAGLLVGAAVLLLRPDVVRTYLEWAGSVPAWTLAMGGSDLAYYYTLSETYPLLLGLLPAIIVTALLRRPALAIYCVIWFGVPLFLHSFLLAMKGARFVLIPYLGLFALAALAAVHAADATYPLLRERLRAWRLSRRSAARGATLIIGAAGLFAFVTLPAASQSRKLPGGDATSRWSRTAAALRSLPELEAVPIGTSRSLHPLYYWGRIDFVLDDPVRHDPALRRAGVGISTDLTPRETEGSVGAPLLMTAEAIRDRFADRGSVLIAVDPAMATHGRIDPALPRLLAADAEELCHGRCGGMLLYHWRFTEMRDEPSDLPPSR